MQNYNYYFELANAFLLKTVTATVVDLFTHQILHISCLIFPSNKTLIVKYLIVLKHFTNIYLLYTVPYIQNSLHE